MNYRNRGIAKLSVGIGAIALAFVCAQPISAQSANTFPGTGNAGAGTTNPQGKLVVSSTNGAGLNTGDLVIENPTAYLIGATRTSAISFKANNGDNLLGYESASIRALMTASPGITTPQAMLQFWTASNTEGLIERMRITETGNVGIGTSSPIHALSVTGNTGLQANFWYATNPFINIGEDRDHTVGGKNRLQMGIINSTSPPSPLRASIQSLTQGIGYFPLTLNEGGGNVGIGTISPAQKFEVQGGQTLIDPTLGAGIYALKVVGTSGAARDVFAAGVTGVSNGFTVQYTGSAMQYAFVGGNVSIGFDPPSTSTYKLDVSGTVHATNIIATYQDVAEWVPASEKLSAGTVVVLDSTKSNQVTSSTVSYDTRVAGVVSEQPGIALGEKSDSKVLVATTGRVRVKVDATKSPIHIGDLLVTSDVPGLAMKSEPIMIGGRQIHAPGTLIGKALEPLEKGKGNILVLLSLQ